MGDLSNNSGQILQTNLLNLLINVSPLRLSKGNHPSPGSPERSKYPFIKKNKYYKSYRKTGNSRLREKYISLRKIIRKKTKDSHETYIETLLGMERQNNQKIPDRVAGQNEHLHTENLQFQSVFTPLVPPSLRYISLMKVQDLVDNKVISPDALPEDLRSSMPLIPDIKISES